MKRSAFAPPRRLLLFLACGFVGCRPAATPAAAPNAPTPAGTPMNVPSGFPRTVTDARGTKLTLSAPPQRIVSLAPSNTEILYALGLDTQIAGDTTACDYPPAAKDKPHVSGALTPIDVEKVEALNPDLVVAVAAINDKTVDTLEKAHVPVLELDLKTLPDLYSSIQQLGSATGRNVQANQLVREMETKIDAIEKTVAAAKTRPKVLSVYSDNPLYTTGPGSFIDDAIRIAGGQNIVTEPLPNNIISPEQVIVRQPDVILCPPEIVTRLKQIPGWATGVPAVKNNRFYTSSTQAPLVRPGPRLPDAIRDLAATLHPDLFPQGGKTPSAPSG